MKMIQIIIEAINYSVATLKSNQEASIKNLEQNGCFNGSTMDNPKNKSYKTIALRNIVVPIIINSMTKKNKKN